MNIIAVCCVSSSIKYLAAAKETSRRHYPRFPEALAISESSVYQQSHWKSRVRRHHAAPNLPARVYLCKYVNTLSMRSAARLRRHLHDVNSLNILAIEIGYPFLYKQTTSRIGGIRKVLNFFLC
jgi:hypothetical protein